MKRISWYLETSGGNLGMSGGGALPFLLGHLAKGVSKVECADFFGVLEFEELVAAVAGHVDEDVASVVG